MISRFNRRPVDPLNQITDQIYLGNLQAATSRPTLQRHGITHILTVGAGLTPAFPNHYKYLYI